MKAVGNGMRLVLNDISYKSNIIYKIKNRIKEGKMDNTIYTIGYSDTILGSLAQGKMI